MSERAKTRRVLLVDDEEDLVWSLARRLRRALVGASVEGTARPEEALAALAAGPVDLLVTDVRMPNVSGLELVVGARKKWPSLPLIVVTAYPTEFMRAAPRRDGAVVYLEKPFELLNLVRQVDRAFSQGARPWFGAEVEREMPLDLVQLFALSNLTGALRLERAGEAGSVWFDRGRITHAETPGRQGEAAFYEALTWGGSAFAIERDVLPPAATLAASPTELITEGRRQLDARRPAARPGPPRPGPPRPSPTSPASFARLASLSLARPITLVSPAPPAAPASPAPPAAVAPAPPAAPASPAPPAAVAPAPPVARASSTRPATLVSPVAPAAPAAPAFPPAPPLPAFPARSLLADPVAHARARPFEAARAPARSAPRLPSEPTDAGPREGGAGEPIVEKENPMANNVQSAIESLRQVEGYIGACVVDSDSGMCLGTDGGGGAVNLEIAAAGNTEVVRAKRKTMKNLNLRDEIEDMLITLGKQYHIIRPLRNRPAMFFYLVVDRTRANLAMARISLNDTEKKLEF